MEIFTFRKANIIAMNSARKIGRKSAKPPSEKFRRKSPVQNEQITESCCSCLAGSTPKPKPVRILNAPTQLCLASSSTPKSRKWPLNEDDHSSQSTNGQPHRTDPPVSLKPVVGDLDVCVLVKAKPLPPSSSSSSFPHHNQSPSPLRWSIENSTALSSSSRTRDGPSTQVFQHIASLQAGFRPKAKYSHLHRVTTTIRDQRQPSAPAPIQHKGLPFSDDFESDCPEHFVSKGKTLLPDDGGAAVHRVGNQAFSLKSSSSEVNLDAGVEYLLFRIVAQTFILISFPLRREKKGEELWKFARLLDGDDAGGEVSEPWLVVTHPDNEDFDSDLFFFFLALRGVAAATSGLFRSWRSNFNGPEARASVGSVLAARL
ncbi:hypothetical protein HPB51_028773 [Rhipicephalus microplus]|uniref:Uncharacterized protein n=1 Tax=Rhipicephalus microplus TaxID=6941 RepID=A0A9J6CWD5_RHIMP|nr:hypothetical protein HPB51_028773 [Rhipicephalus microplus]